MKLKSGLPQAMTCLATEAGTQEQLIAKLKTLIPELLDANGIDAGADVPFELLTRRFEVAHAA